MKNILLIVLVLSISACSSVTIRTDNQKKIRQAPTYEKRFHYYWWGLKGDHKVNVRLACQGKEVKQMQSVYTFGDSVLGLITLGIYSPRTARVWCAENFGEGDESV